LLQQYFGSAHKPFQMRLQPTHFEGDILPRFFNTPRQRGGLEFESRRPRKFGLGRRAARIQRPPISGC